MTADSRDQHQTLTESLRRAAGSHPERGVAIFDGRGRSVERRSYREVLSLAERGAGRLARLGVGCGDRVLVCLPTSWEWMESWLGSVLLGALPVAVAPAGALGSSEAHISKVAAVFERLEARLLVASAALRDEARRLGLRVVAERCTVPEDLASVVPASFTPHRPEPDELAFLQLTSGSTGVPRAVQVPHRAAIHNNRASEEAIGTPLGAPAGSWADSMVSWLPLHHDMGLVGCLFLSIALGIDLSLLPPATFLARPHLWLAELGRRGRTFAPAPNFGYQLCADRVGPERLEGVDLSAWRAALVGAEMVRPETVNAFLRLAEPCGFQRDAIRPCYGLAEGTLAVTFDLRGEGLRTRPRPLVGSSKADDLGPKEVVSVGSPVAETTVEIVAPDGARLGEGQVGEVWVHGPGVFTGYFNDPESTAESLRNGWLATGDLGFLAAGELYLTGRIKDLLIIRGHNLMPHELEWLAEEVTGGGGIERAGAFSVDRGSEGEQAVVVVETTSRGGEALAALAHEIRLRVARSLALPLTDVVFVRRGKIPKTTSGKVQRRELRRRYLDGELERLL